MAIWIVLAGDSHADPAGVRAARCPAVGEVGALPRGFAFDLDEAGETGAAPLDPDEVAAFLSGLRAATPRYIYMAIAGASEDDLRDLREIIGADERALEEFRPWGVELGAGTSAVEALEDARAMLTYRQLSSAEACSGFADWAHGLAGMVAEHALTPVLRIGAVAWLARVALGTEGAGAPAGAAGEPRSEATREAGGTPHGGSLERCGIALEAAGWHVVELRPSGADELALWRVAIERYDGAMTMTLRDAITPDAAMEELLGYARVDAG